MTSTAHVMKITVVNYAFSELTYGSVHLKATIASLVTAETYDHKMLLTFALGQGFKETGLSASIELSLIDTLTFFTNQGPML
jgi:hypothetical protein